MNTQKQSDLSSSQLAEEECQKTAKRAKVKSEIKGKTENGTKFSIPIWRSCIAFSVCFMLPVLLPISYAMYSESNNQQEFIIKIIHGYDASHSNISNKISDKIQTESYMNFI